MPIAIFKSDKRLIEVAFSSVIEKEFKLIKVFIITEYEAIGRAPPFGNNPVHAIYRWTLFNPRTS